MNHRYREPYEPYDLKGLPPPLLLERAGTLAQARRKRIIFRALRTHGLDGSQHLISSLIMADSEDLASL